LDLPRDFQLVSARGRSDERVVSCRSTFGVFQRGLGFLGLFRVTWQKTKREAIAWLLRKLRVRGLRYRWRAFVGAGYRFVRREIRRSWQGLSKLPLRRLEDSVVFTEEFVPKLVRYRWRLRWRRRYSRLFWDPVHVRVRRDQMEIVASLQLGLLLGALVVSFLVVLLIGLGLLAIPFFTMAELWCGDRPVSESSRRWGPFLFDLYLRSCVGVLRVTWLVAPWPLVTVARILT